MTEPNDGDRVPNDDGSAKPDQSSADDQKDQSPDVERYKQDMFKFKSRAKEAEAKAAKLQQQLEERERQRLAEAEDFKALYEREKAANEEKDQKISSLKENVQYSERYRAVLPKLKELGLRDDALVLLDKEPLDEIELEATTNGRFICHGVEAFAEDFKKKYAFAFQQKSPGDIDPRTGRTHVQPGKLTAQDVLEAEKKCKAGKITEKEYEEIYLRFKQGR